MASADSKATRVPRSLDNRLAESLSRDFEEFGLNGYQAKVLVALVRCGSSNATEIARLSGVNRTSVYPVLQELSEKGLAEQVPGRSAQWASPEPDEVLERLYDAQEERLRSLEERKLHTQRTLRHLAADEPGGPLPYVHFLRGAAQVKRAYDRLLAEVRSELLVFNVPPYSWAVGKPNPSVFEALRRGVNCRVLYQADEMDAPDAEGFRRENEAYHAAGVEGRIVDALPAKLLVADRQEVLLAIPDPVLGDEGFPTTLHVDHPGFASMQADSFDAHWAAARPYPG
ncbi:MAG TPA: helix-turn-helix domain-containing protein [Acidimicrobiales bacterium]|nr:helix-turn-helix domain-containing protein [Acidimicrobiales bacterium]